MRAKLLKQLDKYERDIEAQNFIEEFSLYDEMFERKKNTKSFHGNTDLVLEIVASRKKEIIHVANLYGFTRRFKSLNCNPEDFNAGETILKLRGGRQAQFCPKSPFKGYLIKAGSSRIIPLVNNTIIDAGDFLFASINGYQYAVSFIERTMVPKEDELKGLELDVEVIKPIVYSIAVHLLIAMLFVAGSFLVPPDTRETKRDMDRFVSVNIEQLKQRPKPPEPKPEIKKKKEVVTVKPDKKEVKKVVKVQEKPKPKPVVKPKPQPKQIQKAAVKPAPTPPRRQVVSKTPVPQKAPVRTSQTPGFTNKKSQANVKKPTPSVASSSLFKGLGGIGSSKDPAGGANRVLASASNIKGVKSSTPGTFNISGAIANAGGEDVQIVRGGTVQTSAYGGGTGPGAAGRSQATGYIANLGKEATTGVVGGAVMQFPEEEGKILEGEGSLSRAEIFKVIERHAREFRYCYEKQLLKNPSLHGRVVLNWTITTSGSVGSAKWKSSQIQDAEVNTCLVSRLRSLHFPKPKGNPVTVDFPFVFTSASF